MAQMHVRSTAAVCDFTAYQSSLPKWESLLYTFGNSYTSSMRTGFLNTKFYLPMIKLKSQKSEVTLRALKYVQIHISRGEKSLEHYCIRKHTPITATVKWSFLNTKGQQEGDELWVRKAPGGLGGSGDIAKEVNMELWNWKGWRH